MARISKPVLFSQHFKIDPKTLEDAGLIDPFLNADTPLFIDPILLQKSTNAVIRSKGVKQFSERFSRIINLVGAAKKKSDVAWRAARNELDLSEPPTTGLGYGSGRRAGTSRSLDIRDAILDTTLEIIKLGTSNPDMVVAMPFLEKGVGADTISDFTTNSIIEALSEITQKFCIDNGIKVSQNLVSENFQLPEYTDQKRRIRHQILVPTDILQSLPAAADWGTVQKAVDSNDVIRNRVNRLLNGISKPTILDRKEAVREAATQSAETFDNFVSSLKELTDNYDPIEDALGYYRLRRILGSDPKAFFAAFAVRLPDSPEDVLKIIKAIIASFKKHVEDGNLWEELWINGKPKRERAAQLIFFAMSELFCELHDIDTSPEANMGGGPIDFKFSRGAKSRVLVEMKRSSGQVVHGYEKQLEFYKNASNTQFAVFVIIDFGDLGSKVSKIQSIRQRRLNAGQRASEIVVIDATPKKSSSKRD